MFWLCHIDHDEDECPDEGPVGGGGIRFGKALRCLPQKKDAGRRMTIPADDQGARRGLNFSRNGHASACILLLWQAPEGFA